MGLPPDDRAHVFVAIPFDNSFEDVFEFGIAAAVRECKCACTRIDQSSFAGDAPDRIEQEIRSANLVIADVTGARPNVYFEAGLAKGARVQVVYIARQGEVLHFDISTNRCIFYTRIGELKRELKRMIRDLLAPGDGCQA